jgi:serine/threonine-protein kinase
MIGEETGLYQQNNKIANEPQILGEDSEIVEEPENLDFELSNPLPNLSLEKFYDTSNDKFTDVKRTEVLPRFNVEENIDPMIGQVIADYKMVELLDVTYYWKEYKAVHGLFNTFSILRLISDSYANDPVFENRFLREAKVSIKLSHQNIISLATSGKFNNRYYFIRDFIETVRVEELVNKKGRLKSEITIVIAKQIASALLYAHKNNIIHRNINPSNILLDKTGKVYLYDFGFSTIVGNQGTGQTLTAGSIDPRSLIYRSPELYLQTPYADQQSDIYSFCAVLFFTVSGIPPFASPGDILLKETPQLPSGIPGMSEDFAEIIHKGLEKNPFKRFECAEDLLVALENIRK